MTETSPSSPISPHVIIEINDHQIDYSKLSSPPPLPKSIFVNEEDREEIYESSSVVKKVFKTFFNFKNLLDEKLIV